MLQLGRAQFFLYIIKNSIFCNGIYTDKMWEEKSEIGQQFFKTLVSRSKKDTTTINASTALANTKIEIQTQIQRIKYFKFT